MTLHTFDPFVITFNVVRDKLLPVFTFSCSQKFTYIQTVNMQNVIESSLQYMTLPRDHSFATLWMATFDYMGLDKV